ncbi:hypothetical protein [Methylomusa anaerophila]|uniref:hypothetical protein n=1 Tax=Methylomusa anaerophila TaxID=1930071 RepID=UPI000F832235|nr:hypothetical protein [Methylomusa anaerophila]
MLEFIFVLAVVGAHRVVDGDVLAGDVGVLAAENGGAGAVDIVAGGDVDVAANRADGAADPVEGLFVQAAFFAFAADGEA